MVDTVYLDFSKAFDKIFYEILKYKIEKQPWFVCLSRLSAGLSTERSPVRFPVRVHAWVAGQVPCCVFERGYQ